MKKIKTGNVEIGPDEFNPKKWKFRVNMFVDLDVVDEIRKAAAKRHVPYQTLINHVIHLYVTDQLVNVQEVKKMVNAGVFDNRKMGNG